MTNADDQEYETYRNKYNVVHITFNDVPRNCSSYEQYINRIEDYLLKDIRREFPDVQFDSEDAVWDVFMALYMEYPDIQFIFVLDEWDFIFHQDFVTEADEKAYLVFLRSLLKDRPYVCLAAMVVYGFLSYENGMVSIPNKELMDKFSDMLKREISLGYVYQLAKKSEKMLRATLAGDTKTMELILETAHDTEISILSYNHETELSAVVNLVYLSARDNYRVERRKSGKRFCGLYFLSRNILSCRGNYSGAESGSFSGRSHCPNQGKKLCVADEKGIYETKDKIAENSPGGNRI